MAPIPPGFTLWAAGDGAGARLMLGAVWSGGKAAILAAAQKSESPWDTDLKGRDDKPFAFSRYSQSHITLLQAMHVHTY